jgi:hypothetical protein
MKRYYFGQGCEHHVGKWENENLLKEMGVDYKNTKPPQISSCGHSKNKSKKIENCCGALCPERRRM